MTTASRHSPDAIRLERTYDAPAELIWELWTTAPGLEEWFAPDGFATQVSELEFRPGGQLRYIMTATAPEQVAFMRDTGIRSRSRCVRRSPRRYRRPVSPTGH
jgi:uncharacterized protein YndB with AHSA1/START domain